MRGGSVLVLGAALLALATPARGQDGELEGRIGLWSVRVWTVEEKVYYRLTGPTETSGYQLLFWCYGESEFWEVDRGDAWSYSRTREGGLWVRFDDGPEERWDLSADDSSGALRGFWVLWTDPPDPDLRLNPGLARRMRTARMVTFRRDGYREAMTFDFRGLFAAWVFASKVTGQCPLSRS